jgi:hypothetical protein
MKATPVLIVTVAENIGGRDASDLPAGSRGIGARTG